MIYIRINRKIGKLIQYYTNQFYLKEILMKNATKEEVFNAAVNAKIEKFFNHKEMGPQEDCVSEEKNKDQILQQLF